MQPTQPTNNPPVTSRDADNAPAMRSREFRPRRSVWPGVLGVAVITAAITAVVVSNYYDDRTVGARVDAGVAAAEITVNGGVDGLRNKAASAAQGTAEAADRVAGALDDTAITAAVKTALAADPTLSAVRIDVSTTHGAVRLQGPAPDAKSRQRAEVLAMAPSGVVRVDNRLVVPAAIAAPTAKAATISAAPAVPSAANATPAPTDAAPALPPLAAVAPAPVDTPAAQ